MSEPDKTPNPDERAVRTSPTPEPDAGNVFRGFKATTSPRPDDPKAQAAQAAAAPMLTPLQVSTTSSTQATPAPPSGTPKNSPQLTPMNPARRPPPRSLSFSEVEREKKAAADLLNVRTPPVPSSVQAVLEQINDPVKMAHVQNMLRLNDREQSQRRLASTSQHELATSPSKRSSRRATFTGLESIGEFIPAASGPAPSGWEDESSSSGREDENLNPGPWLATPERRAKVERMPPLLNIAELERCPRTNSAGSDKTERLVKGLLRAIEDAEREHGPDSPPVAALSTRLGHVYHSQGRHEDARVNYRRALEANREALGGRHPNVASSLNDLAGLYEAMGQTERAERNYKRAIVILDERGVYGGRNPLVPRTNSFGSNSGGESDRRRRASADLLVTPPTPAGTGPHPGTLATAGSGGPGVAAEEEDADLAILLCNLAGLYTAAQRVQEAQPLLERAMKTAARARGPLDPLYAACTAGLAHVHAAMHEPVKARGALRQAISNSERTLGLASTDIVQLYRSLASLCTGEEALMMYNDAIAVREQALGPMHRSLAAWQNALGSLYTQQGKLYDALPKFQRALNIDENCLGPDHPDVSDDLSAIASLYVQMNRLDDALELYKRSLDIDRKAYGKDHTTVVQDLQSISRVYFSQHKYEISLDYCRQALEMDERIMGPDSSHCAYDLCNAARICEKMKRYDEARQYLERAHTSLEKSPERQDGPNQQQVLDKIRRKIRRLAEMDEAEPADFVEGNSDEERDSERRSSSGLFAALCLANSVRSLYSDEGTPAAARRTQAATPGSGGSGAAAAVAAAEAAGPSGGCHAFVVHAFHPCLPSFMTRRLANPVS